MTQRDRDELIGLAILFVAFAAFCLVGIALAWTFGGDGPGQGWWYFRSSEI